MNMLMGHGLFFLEGQPHKVHRKVISSVFHWELIKETVPMIVELARSKFDDMEKGGLEGPKAIMQEFQKVTGEVMGRIFFNEQLGKHTFKGEPLTLGLAKMIPWLFNLSFTPPMLIMGKLALKVNSTCRQAVRDIQEFRGICLSVVKEKRAVYQERKMKGWSGKKDMLDSLFELMESGSDETLTENDIVDEFITFFFGGMDTTAHLLAHTVYYLTQNPEHVSKLREEVDKFYKDGRDLTVESLQNMDYMTAVLKETLRIATPLAAMAPRFALQDTNLGDIKIKKGTMVNISLLTNHFDEELFEDPHKYKPSRWIENPNPKDTFGYIPFSSGFRNCIGQHLAMIEARITLSEFLRRYDFELKLGYVWKLGFGLMYGPANELEIILKKRKI